MLENSLIYISFKNFSFKANICKKNVFVRMRSTAVVVFLATLLELLMIGIIYDSCITNLKICIL